jgi:uncharacterized protein YcbX
VAGTIRRVNDANPPQTARSGPRAPDAGPACRIASLHLYPVKSCAGVDLTEAELLPTGLDLDRTWMVVDEAGRMLTQRQCPRLALVQPQLRHQEVLLRAPGMLALHLRVDTVEAPTRAQVWGDIVRAFDMGALAAQWFSDFLGRPARLVRFDPEETRTPDPAWAAGTTVGPEFADGFPLLVASTASLAALNERLAEAGAEPVTMARFRPNVVLEGLQAFDEDHLGDLFVETEPGPVHLRLTKPCVRCSVPNVDPATAETGTEPGRTLAGFRADARVQGGITFGMNAVVLAGSGGWLRVGQAVDARWAF